MQAVTAALLSLQDVISILSMPTKHARQYVETLCKTYAQGRAGASGILTAL